MVVYPIWRQGRALYQKVDTLASEFRTLLLLERSQSLILQRVSGWWR